MKTNKRHQLPQMLCTDGLLTKQLASSKSVIRSADEKKLHKSLSRSIDKLRTHFSTRGWKEFGDDLVRYIALSSGKTNPALRDRALMKYLSASHLYDSVLGDLVPNKFRKRAKIERDWQPYVSGEHHNAEQDWDAFKWSLDQPAFKGMAGLPTGIDSLDSALGGLRGVTVIGGREGDGKTCLALYIALSALDKCDDLSVVYYTLDMPKYEIYTLMLSQAAAIDSRSLPNPKTREVRRQIKKGESWLREEILPRIRVLEHTRQTAEFYDIDAARHCSDLRRHSQTSNSLIVVDALQDLNITLLPGQTDLEIARAEFLRYLRGRGITVIATSHVRKRDQSGEDLTSEDLLGASHLRYAADTILLLGDPSINQSIEPVVPRVCKIAKGRRGVRRERLTLDFEHTIARFSEPRPGASKKVGSEKVRTNVFAAE